MKKVQILCLKIVIIKDTYLEKFDNKFLILKKLEDFIMKSRSFIYIVIISFLILFVIFIGCDKKKKSNPVSYVDRYEPDYNEEKGTSYTGNFFPIAAGKQWNYYGTMDGIMKMKIKGNYGGQSINETETDTMDYPYCEALSRILPSVDVVLGGELCSLYPEEGYARFSSEYSYPEIIRYYEVTDSIVYIRAVPGEYGLLEVNDPVFIKSTLVVGDSWSSNPTMNTSSYISEEEGDIEMEADCKLFVVGMDKVYCYVDGFYQEIQAMQLDEVAEISGKVELDDVEGSIELKLYGKLRAHIYLAEDIGIVAMNEYIELSMEGKISDSNGSITIDIDITSEDYLTLSSHYGSTLAAKNQPKRLFKGKVPENLENVILKVTQLINIMKPM